MSRRLSEMLFLFVLGVAITVLPIACGSSNDSTDGANDGRSDRVTSMTPG